MTWLHDQRYLATTQFEPCDARHAFPCWDEVRWSTNCVVVLGGLSWCVVQPAVKATFDITLRVPRDLVALSNMNVISSVVEGELKSVKFATTPIMSTYLLAFIVGDLEYLETHTTKLHGQPQPIACRVYTTRGEKEKGRFALDLSAKVLDFYADLFDIPYPLPKMDMVAIPDFAAGMLMAMDRRNTDDGMTWMCGIGAMENWGLVTYRTSALLYDPKTTSLRRKQYIGYVVAHELAHQWFGNLVTMEWWSDLWLNEGFATWYSVHWAISSSN